MLTIEEVRRHLEVDLKDEDILQSLIDEVVSLWEDQTGLLWNTRSGYVEQKRLVDNKKILALSLVNVTSITKVEVKDVGDEYEELEPTEYELDKRRLHRITGFWEDWVRVTYSGGYSSSTCPSDIKRALLVQLDFQRKRFSGNQTVMASQAFEAGSTNYLAAHCHPFFEKMVKSKRAK